MRGLARKTVLIGLGFGLATVGAMALWRHERPSPSHVLPAPALHHAADPAKRLTPEDIEGLKEEIARLKADKDELAQLSGELKSDLTSLHNKLTRAGLEGSAGLAAGDNEADAAPLTPEEERERVAAQIQTEIELIEETMLAEKTDPQWANEAQLALTYTFQSELVPGLSLVDAECRTTLCRMELLLDGSTPEDGVRKLAHLAPWPGESLLHIDLEAGIAVGYLSREGHSLPRLTE
jgi:hypothetical protein